MTVKVYNPFQK